jgi:DNA (cytosine-5)-methyltransferase 1
MYNQNTTGNVATTMRTGGGPEAGPSVLENLRVRRLMPIECERLQGFPDNYTNIPYRGRSRSPDGLRYKALGNSMAVPVMHWIGKRIAIHEESK